MKVENHQIAMQNENKIRYLYLVCYVHLMDVYLSIVYKWILLNTYISRTFRSFGFCLCEKY